MEKDLSVMTRFYFFISTGAYSGLSPVAPGTAGTFAAMVILGVLFQVSPNILHPNSLIVLALITFALGTYATDKAIKGGAFGEDSKDPGKVVIDEFAGYFVACIGASSLTHLLIAFFLFRFFDILKPSPVRNVEKLPGAVGIMADDVLAGVYAAIVLNVIIAFLPGL